MPCGSGFVICMTNIQLLHRCIGLKGFYLRMEKGDYMNSHLNEFNIVFSELATQ